MMEVLEGVGPQECEWQRKLELRWEGHCHSPLAETQRGDSSDFPPLEVFSCMGCGVYHLCFQLSLKGHCPIRAECRTFQLVIGSCITHASKQLESERGAGKTEQGSWTRGRIREGLGWGWG